MATPLCDIDGSRPAVATVRIRENGKVVTETYARSTSLRREPVGSGSETEDVAVDEACSTSSSPTSSRASAEARQAGQARDPSARSSRST